MAMAWFTIAGMMMLAALLIVLYVAIIPDEDVDALEPTMTTKPEPMDEDTLHPQITEDIKLLAKIMQQESRDGWSEWAVMSVGEVVLNRVASPLFPNTIREVLFQTGPIQYAPVWSEDWERLEPNDEYIQYAIRLLDGERVLNDPNVVYQALFPQGTWCVMTYHDEVLDNTTYFCK